MLSVSRNGVYKIYDHMHVALPRIIPRIMPPNHTRESYHESYPFFAQGRAKHTPKHTPETYLRNIPRIIPPDATRFAGHGVFGKGHLSSSLFASKFGRLPEPQVNQVGLFVDGMLKNGKWKPSISHHGSCPQKVLKSRKGGIGMGRNPPG